MPAIYPSIIYLGRHVTTATRGAFPPRGGPLTSLRNRCEKVMENAFRELLQGLMVTKVKSHCRTRKSFDSINSAR